MSDTMRDWVDRCAAQAQEIANLTAQIALVLTQADEVQGRLLLRERERDDWIRRLGEKDRQLANARATIAKLRGAIPARSPAPTPVIEQAPGTDRTCKGCCEPFTITSGRAGKREYCEVCRPVNGSRAAEPRCPGCAHGVQDANAELGWYCRAERWRACEPQGQAFHFVRR